MSEGRSEPAGADVEALPPSVPKLGWQHAVLVCKQCQKRRSGPSKLDARTVGAALKRGVAGAPVRTRIALTGCLGPCPEKAITVVAGALDDAAATAWAVGSKAEARALGAELGRRRLDPVAQVPAPRPAASTE